MSNHDNTGQGQAPGGRKLLGLIEIPVIESNGWGRPKSSITKTKSVKFLDMIKTLRSDIRNRDLGSELDDVIKNGGSRVYEMQNPWEKAGVFEYIIKVSVNLLALPFTSYTHRKNYERHSSNIFTPLHVIKLNLP